LDENLKIVLHDILTNWQRGMVPSGAPIVLAGDNTPQMHRFGLIHMLEAVALAL